MRLALRKLWDDRRGATAVEYGLIVGLVVIAAFAALAGTGNQTATMWGNIDSRIREARGG